MICYRHLCKVDGRYRNGMDAPEIRSGSEATRHTSFDPGSKIPTGSGVHHDRQGGCLRPALHVENLHIRINTENPQQNLHAVAVGAIIDRFLQGCAPKRCRQHTRNNYRGLFNNHIRPRWETEFVQNVKTTAVEGWLESYSHPRQIKSHV